MTIPRRRPKEEPVTDASVAELVDPQFWRLPLEDRMARFAELREIGPFLPASFENPMTGLTEAFCGHDPLRRGRRDQPAPAKTSAPGKGAVSIPDMPAEALEFFGSFINMDDPRHARQRGIVARSFTPAAAPGACSTRSRRSAPR